jgi:hypothetical protein
MSLEMAQKVIVPQKKNYVPHFLKQRDINSYFFKIFTLVLLDRFLYGFSKFRFFIGENCILIRDF